MLSAVRLPADLAAGTSRGQYAAGWQGGEEVGGYLDEDGVAPGSRTETYAAVRLDVDTRRWAGVPFYLRTGKRLGKRVTEIAVVFKKAPHLPFSNTATEELGQNAVVIRVQPDEGVTLRFGAEGARARRWRSATSRWTSATAARSPSPRRRPTSGSSSTCCSASRRSSRGTRRSSCPGRSSTRSRRSGTRRAEQPEQYASGGWGPDSADAMMRRDGREWRLP